MCPLHPGQRLSGFRNKQKLLFDVISSVYVKPTVMRDFIDAGIIKTIDSLAWGTLEILYPNHKRHLN